jgi:hypothetical protein
MKLMSPSKNRSNNIPFKIRVLLKSLVSWKCIGTTWHKKSALLGTTGVHDFYFFFFLALHDDQYILQNKKAILSFCVIILSFWLIHSMDALISTTINRLACMMVYFLMLSNQMFTSKFGVWFQSSLRMISQPHAWGTILWFLVSLLIFIL